MRLASGPALVLALAAAYAFTGLLDRELTAPDEIRVAEVGREMAVSGDVLVPRLNGEPFLEHPPTFYAAVALSLKAFGVSDGAARVPVGLSTVALLLLAYDLGRRLGGPRAGVLLVLVLATTGGVLRYSHRAMVDTALACAVGLSYWAWARLLLREDPARDRPRPALVLALYGGAALAFLVKGPVGPLLVAAPIAVDVVVHRRVALLRSWPHAAGLLLLLAACAAWPLALLRFAGDDIFRGYVLGNVVQRVVPGEGYAGGHVHPAWYYLGQFPGMVGLWLLAVPAVWLAGRGEGRRDAERFLAWVFPIGLLALSVPATKRALYLLPLLLPLAVAVGVWLDRLPLRATLGRLERLTLRVLAAPFAALPALARRDPFDWRRLRETGPRVAWACFALALVVNLVPGVFGDADKDTHTLADDLVRSGALQGALAGYQLDERARATVPFRTGVILPDLQEPEELRRFLGAHPEGRLLIRDETCSTLPESDRSALVPLQSWDFGRQRYLLFAARAPGVGRDP